VTATVQAQLATCRHRALAADGGKGECCRPDTQQCGLTGGSGQTHGRRVQMVAGAE